MIEIITVLLNRSPNTKYNYVLKRSKQQLMGFEWKYYFECERAHTRVEITQ